MKLSIITVCYNSQKYISNCIESVLNLKENDYEYIIIDGNSTDQTLKIAEKYIDSFKEKNVSYRIISEPDSGIYDAMNKGIKNAKGDWILYMNSDDCFYNEGSISEFVNSDLNGYEVVYGDVIVKNGSELIYQKPRDLNKLKSGTEMPFCHQSTFVRREIMEKYKFNLAYKIIADIDLFLRIFEDGLSFKYLPTCIAVFSNDGISQTNRIQSIQEAKKMLRNHGYYKLEKRIVLNCYIMWYFCKKIIKRR